MQKMFANTTPTYRMCLVQCEYWKLRS